MTRTKDRAGVQPMAIGQRSCRFYKKRIVEVGGSDRRDGLGRHQSELEKSKGYDDRDKAAVGKTGFI